MTAVGTRSGRASRSGGYHRAVRLVTRWAAFYTRDLDPDLAAERREELASDLWEQGAESDARGASGVATGASILWRAARGVPADLSWRRTHEAGLGAGGAGQRGWSGRGSFAVAVLIAGAILAFALVVDVRVGMNVIRGLAILNWTVIGPVGLGGILLVCAMLLLVRERTRWLGAFWLAAVAPAVLGFGMRAMFGVSATFQWFLDGTVAFGPSWWELSAVACVGALALFFAAMGIAWLPARTPSAEVHR